LAEMLAVGLPQRAAAGVRVALSITVMAITKCLIWVRL
jgi:hypothetical protein